MTPGAVLAVTFDFGQTLAEIDLAFLARRLGERGVAASAGELERALPAAWRRYDALVRAAEGAGAHPWKELIGTLLRGGGVDEGAIVPSVDWLFSEQPTKNIWRRPIPGMIELARDLARAGVGLAVVSNSEGGAARLLGELGWAETFPVVADSGLLGIEKPARGIFAWAADRLGVPLEAIVHVGDSRAADVEGALAAGMRAIWFGGDPTVDLGPRAATCSDAAEVAAVLRRWGTGGV